MELSQYHDIWNESWRYFRHYAEKIPLSDEDWKEVIDMSSIFVDRHMDHERFARKLIVIIVREIEMRDREARKKR